MRLRSVILLQSLLLPCSIAAADGGPAGVPVEAGGQKRNGGVLEVGLSTQLLSVGGGGAAASLGLLRGGIFGGFKADRVIVGLGFDLQRIEAKTSSDARPDTATTSTMLMIAPGIRVALLRSTDRRVELFAQFDAAFGTILAEQTPAPMATTDRFRFAFDLAPGVRYWAHPQFAVAAIGGARGDLALDSTGTQAATARSSALVVSIFGGLQLIGVF